MTSEYLPALSMNTRYDAFQGVQVPPSGPVSSYPTMYPVYGLPRPPLTSLPTATHPSPPSFFPDSYGSTGPSFMPNYQGQGTVFPPATITPTAFQKPFYPSTGMFPRGVTANYLPSEYTGHFEQSAPPTFQWPLCIQPEVATTQWHAQNQVAQDFLVMQPPQEPRSVYRENYQTNATCHASSSSAPEVSLQGNQWENQPAFQLPAENTMPNNRHHGHESKYAPGSKMYYCELCHKWVLTRRKKQHDQKHSPSVGSFVCKIGEVLGKQCKPLSRKDALKRHVDVKHPEYAALMTNFALEILVPRRRNEPANLGALHRAVCALNPKPQA